MEDGLIRTQKEAARYAGVTERQIRRWKNQQGMPLATNGWYRKDMLIVWKKREENGSGALLAEHRQRETIATAGIKEKKDELLALELAIRRGKWHETAGCAARQLRKLIDLTRGIEAMRRRVEARCPPEIRAAVSQIMKEEIRRMRDQFAKE